MSKRRDGRHKVEGREAIPIMPPSVQAAKYVGENNSILLFGLTGSGIFFFN